MMMPEMDGVQLGAAIKNDPLIRDIRMVMLTSRGIRGDAAMMKKIGFDAYLLKPLRKSQLNECLAKILGRKEPEAEAALPDLVTGHSIAEDARRHVRILLVEDNDISQKMELYLLDKLGYRADTANNGREAIRLLEKNHYDLVLMDIQMPEMDGMQATEIIRQPDSGVLNHWVPIIAMTANSLDEDREKCLEAGMDAYMAKPFSPRTFCEIVEKYIQKTLPENETKKDNISVGSGDVGQELEKT